MLERDALIADLLVWFLAVRVWAELMSKCLGGAEDGVGVGSGVSASMKLEFNLNALSSAPNRQKRFLCCPFLHPSQGFCRVACQT